MSLDITNLKKKAEVYKTVVSNTDIYRQQWPELKKYLMEQLTAIINEIQIKAQVSNVDKLENLESVILDFGKTSSGISEHFEDSGVKRTMIKSNGSLIYQQLFNGKIMVMVLPPSIEGYGEPKPPKSLEILRPEELQPTNIVSHIEVLLKEVIDWEDYDDNEPSKPSIGFQPIGFSNGKSQE